MTCWDSIGFFLEFLLFEYFFIYEYTKNCYSIFIYKNFRVQGIDKKVGEIINYYEFKLEKVLFIIKNIKMIGIIQFKKF